MNKPPGNQSGGLRFGLNALKVESQPKYSEFGLGALWGFLVFWFSGLVALINVDEICLQNAYTKPTCNKKGLGR
jgi:hypothetical protein